MFSIANLTDTSHTYTIVLERAPDGKIDPFYIDRIMIVTVLGSLSLSQSPSLSPSSPLSSLIPASLSQLPSSSAPTSLSHSSSSTSQSSSSISSGSLSQVPSLSIPTPQSLSQSQSSPVSPASTPYSSPLSSSPVPGAGAIAGIIVGVIAVITLIVALIWYRRRLTRVAHPSTSLSPFIEEGMYLDDKRPEQVTQSADPSTVIPSSLAPVPNQTMALVPTFSSLEQGAAAAATITTSEDLRVGRGNSGDVGPSLNPTASSLPPLSMPLQPFSGSGGVNISSILQAYSMLRDQVQHLAALQSTAGGVGGVGESHHGEGHSNYHGTPPGYIEGRDTNEETHL